MTYITLNAGKLEWFTGFSVCIDGRRNYGNEHYATLCVTGDCFAGDIDDRVGSGAADGKRMSILFRFFADASPGYAVDGRRWLGRVNRYWER